MSSNPVLRRKEAPTLAKTDEVLDKFVEQIVKADDANDVLMRRSFAPLRSWPELEKSVPRFLQSIPPMTSLTPELAILERQIKRVPLRTRDRDSDEPENARRRQ